MPSFSEEKRDQVRESLRDTGRELFTRQGIRKTTISELTGPAGIGTGTFYQYFDSKEALYIDILEQESREVIPRLLRESFEAHDDPETAIAALLEQSLNEIESNAIFRQVIIDEQELPRIREQIPDEEASEKRTSAIDHFLPYIESWYDDGKVNGSDPEAIAHTIRAVVRLAQQKDHIGEERYPRVRETLIEAVAAGLTRDPDSEEFSNE
ncbi:TetR/AcrR family transcriptional regulator [Natrinema gelatinilyticum]|uniref:TetR/AcrR family transcriptional regulator n=1 Tax=Natrinema gelatinilyticum TaxID=2961571 RepID=UPI0020C21D44|nr:TetR/AcrR family transcriptional regulator [Natrinema gelatinilyticum]